MPTKHPAKPSDGKKKAANPEKASRSGARRPETAKRCVSKLRPANPPSREGESLYSSLFLKNHAVMLIIDPRNGRIVDANKAALQFYGYTPGKLKTLRISDINMPDAGDVRLKMQKALEGEERYFLFRHRLADGTLRDVEVNSGPIVVKKRKLLYSIVHDVTVRTQAEQALRDSEKRYRLLVDNAEFAVVVTSLATGRVLFINERASILFDVPASRIGEGQARDYWVRAEDRDRFVADLTAKGRVTEYECALKTARGGTLWVLISASIIDFGGEQAAFIVYNDITGRKKAEDALVESEARYRRLFEDAVLGIFQTTAEGEILTINPAFARIFGYDSVDDFMMNVKNVAADLYACPSLRPNIVKMILDSNGPVQVENQYRRKDGSV
ncbi:MAG TPA: PAS domain S-box protein, partial [Syntrophales bacterium]